MRIAYLECFSGISGDMFLGALVDAGVSPRLLQDTVAALEASANLGARLEISRVVRSGITATKVDVYVDGKKDSPREEIRERPHEHDNSPGEEHSHEHHGHSHSHDVGATHKSTERASRPLPHEHEHSHGHSHGRGLTEIRQIIFQAGISDRAKKTAIAIFEALGAAEARVHNVDIEKIHFHEVGAIDAIVDIVCAAVGVEALGVDEWVCSALNVGGGMVKCAHGTFPVPAPATLDLLKNVPIYSGEIQKELVTPTGAAIVHVLATRFGKFPQMKTTKIGYGAGSRDFKDFPNVLRLTIGDSAD